ncbi:DUF2634 domain-containing protein [Lactobacillus delbrueckii]|uniref:DUF2634 domain-containing protein n=1 Tax=Lactobacillus delbrueckii TaxID=1584 RepID=UPI000DED5823|nr:DUF2634 domain-containing protein [Lactobacillus delbrueckii]MCH5408839.1 DUF2634 domain-containing protein [Lactobacillus delbrueckii]RCK09200.1 DUF2634 domain-containing protein [Lactobacillus delbrueckii subsp. bulgaricus]
MNDDEELNTADDLGDVEDDQTDDPEADDNDAETSLTWEVKNGRIFSKIDDEAAVVQAVTKILETERSVYPIYSEDYGHDLDELIGKSEDYVEAEIQRVLEEALTQDDQITGVTVDDFDVHEDDTATITATVTTIYGDLTVEQEVATVDSTE